MSMNVELFDAGGDSLCWWSEGWNGGVCALVVGEIKEELFVGCCVINFYLLK